jgi:hypothetical protein
MRNPSQHPQPHPHYSHVRLPHRARALPHLVSPSAGSLRPCLPRSTSGVTLRWCPVVNACLPTALLTSHQRVVCRSCRSLTSRGREQHGSPSLISWSRAPGLISHSSLRYVSGSSTVYVLASLTVHLHPSSTPTPTPSCSTNAFAWSGCVSTGTWVPCASCPSLHQE